MQKVVVLSLYDLDEFNTCKPQNCQNIDCDIFLCMPNVDPKYIQINAKIAIVYGDLGFKSYKKMKCGEIITYGMSSKNSVTPSSIADDTLLLSIQRSILKLDGEQIPIGEVSCAKNHLSNLDNIAINVLNLILN